jgi:predicted nucleic acid-binding protein
VRFVDTNVLLYAVSSAPKESGKARIARQILDAEDLAVSVQVLQEFYVQATRPAKPGRLTPKQAGALVEAFLRFHIQDLTVSLMIAAQVASERFRISYWDAAIVEAARSLGCETLLSEDLSHGQNYAGVRVTNPFRSGA